MSGESPSRVDTVALNLERAMQSRRQYFATPLVSGVRYSDPVHNPPESQSPFGGDTFSDDSVQQDPTASVAASPDFQSSPSYLVGTSEEFSSPSMMLPQPRTATVRRNGSQGRYTQLNDVVEEANSAERFTAVSTSPDVAHQRRARQTTAAPHSPQAASTPDGEARRRQQQQAAIDTARRDRDVALQRVELLTAALDDARHQILNRDSELDELRADRSALEEALEQAQYECQRLQSCAHRDHLYQTQCALVLLSSQEEHARRALVVTEEKWRLSIVFAQQWEGDQQRRGEALDRWAQQFPSPLLKRDEPQPAPAMPPLLSSPTSPLTVVAVRRHVDPGSPAMRRSASLPVSPRTRGASSHRSEREPTSARPSHTQLDGSLAGVKAGLLSEVTAAKKQLESDLALAQVSLRREEELRRARDEELTLVRTNLAQEQQLSRDLQDELEDMVLTELLLRETAARCLVESTESQHHAALVSHFSFTAMSMAREAIKQRQARDNSLSSASHYSTPVRVSSPHGHDTMDATKRTPPNRSATPAPVSPLPSPSALPAIRLREAQLEHYRRHMDPFDESWVGSTDASMASMPLGYAGAPGPTPGGNGCSSPVRVPGGFSLQEVRSMMDQLLKSYLMPLKLSVESMKAVNDETRQHQRTQLETVARALEGLQHLTASDLGVGARNQEMVERVGAVVTDCHETLVAKVDKLQETQHDVLRQVQEVHRVSKKSARILSHNDVVMDGRLKDIVACQSSLSRRQLTSSVGECSPEAFGGPGSSASPTRVRSSSPGISPDGQEGHSGSDSPTATGTDAAAHSSGSQRGMKQVSFQMPLFESHGQDTRKSSVMEMSRSATDVPSSSHLLAEGEALFKPHSVAFASPPSHVWDLVDSDDESVPPLPDGTGFRTPYDVDSVPAGE